MAETNTDFRQILTDVQSIPLLSLYVSFKYSDPAYNKSIKIEHQQKYRIVYISDRALTKIVGIVVAINRVYNGEIGNNPPEYIMTVDCSTEYGSNVKKIKTSTIRDIKIYVDHMDDDVTIADAETGGGVTVGNLTQATIKNVIIYTDGTVSGGEITGGTPSGGKTDGTTTGGITYGKNPNGTDITKNGGTTTGGNVDGGSIIKGTIVITDGKTYTVTPEEDGSKTFTGDIANVVIVNSHVTGGSSTGGTVIDPKPTGTIVYGGSIVGGGMITTGGITKDNVTYGGTITGGTVTGGDAIGTWDGRQIHMSGNIVTTGGITTGGTVIGGTVTGGQTIAGITYNGTVVGGVGTAGITTGGQTTGGKISYKDFDTSTYPLSGGDASKKALEQAVLISNGSTSQGIDDDSWEHIPSGLIVTWNPNMGIRSNIADPNANIVPVIQVSKPTGVEVKD